MFILRKCRPVISLNAIGQRSISTTIFKLQHVETNLKKYKEVEIEVPWGQIAGKWYGSDKVQPTLMIHGWQDNAGSFNTLIPLLPIDFSYLAIDLPGHGLSSHYPKGVQYSSQDYVLLLELIRKTYNWDRLSLVSHSMGSIISFVYAAIFPKNVNLVCALDTLKLQNHEPKFVANHFMSRIKNLVRLNEKLENPPEYTYDEIVERVHTGSLKSINLDKAKHLIERGTKRSTSDPNKFYFSRDIRVKYMQPSFTDQQVGLDFIMQIKAAYLFIRSCDKDFSESQKNIDEAVEVFKIHNKQFEMLQFNGTHHNHLNNPELMAGKISEFLKKYHPKKEQL